MKNSHAIHKTQLSSPGYGLLGWERAKHHPRTGSGLVHGALKNLHKTSRTSTMLCSSFMWAQQGGSKGSTNAGWCETVSTSHLSTIHPGLWHLQAGQYFIHSGVNDCESLLLVFWKQCAKCDVPLTDCCMSAQNFRDKCFLHQVSSLTLIQTFSLWSSDSIRTQCWNTVPFTNRKYWLYL